MIFWDQEALRSNLILPKMKDGSAQHIVHGLILGCRFSGCTFYFSVNILQFLAKHIRIKLQLFFEYRVRSPPPSQKKTQQNNNNNNKTRIICSRAEKIIELLKSFVSFHFVVLQLIIWLAASCEFVSASVHPWLCKYAAPLFKSTSVNNCELQMHGLRHKKRSCSCLFACTYAADVLIISLLWVDYESVYSWSQAAVKKRSETLREINVLGTLVYRFIDVICRCQYAV